MPGQESILVGEVANTYWWPHIRLCYLCGVFMSAGGSGSSRIGGSTPRGQGVLGLSWGRLVPRVELSWGPLGASGTHFGIILELSRGLLKVSWEPFCDFDGPCRRPLERLHKNNSGMRKCTTT